MYNQIAGPSHRLDTRKTSDAGLDIDADAIRNLQVSFFVFEKQKTNWNNKGRKREDVQFIEAKVDTSLGNIRENIRKSANQKHVSTSMVDPLKAMKKNGMCFYLKKNSENFLKIQKNSGKS